MIMHLFFLLFVCLMSLILHEFGHKFAIETQLNTKVKMKWSLKDSLHYKIPHYARPEQINVIILAGIGAGLIPIVVFWGAMGTWYNVFVFVAYLFGCRHDIIELGINNKRRAQ